MPFRRRSSSRPVQDHVGDSLAKRPRLLFSQHTDAPLPYSNDSASVKALRKLLPNADSSPVQSLSSEESSAANVNEESDKHSLSPNFLSPKLSFGANNDEFKFEACPAALPHENNSAPDRELIHKEKCNFNGILSPKSTSIGEYEIVREADDCVHLQDRHRAYIVKEKREPNNVGLCRCISRDKYQHYVELYRRLSAPLPNDRSCLKDYDEEKVLDRLWPKKSKLFTFRDEQTRENRHYLYTPRHFGSLHVHVIDRNKPDFHQAMLLYRQIIEAAALCHSRGIILRDVKLRKFVFADEQRQSIRFFDLDELHVLSDPKDDTMRDRNGCPAYVSPEIIDFQAKSYAGKPADVWGLGVLLYVMLIGRYPFYDTTPLGLFVKIRSANFGVPNRVSDLPYELRCAVRFLLRKDPKERLTSSQLLRIPCLKVLDESSYANGCSYRQDPASSSLVADELDVQVVPCLESKFVKLSNRLDEELHLGF